MERRTVLGVSVEIHLTHSVPVRWEHPQHCCGSRKVAPDSSLPHPSLYKVPDPYNGAVWMLELCFVGIGMWGRGGGYLLVTKQPGLSLHMEKSKQNYRQLFHVRAGRELNQG